MSEQVNKIIGKVFEELATGLETGTVGERPKIGVTALGSEHGEQNAIKGALEASKAGIDVTIIGKTETKGLTLAEIDCAEDGHKKMEELLDNGDIDGCVTMHYPFPIGVSTVGRIITPGIGKEMFIATTTGTSSTDRIQGMVLNTIYGIISAKACGNPNPTVGIANVDGARQVEKALRKLQDNGYKFEFAESARADGGVVMRGNDLLLGTSDIMVIDPLTGNLMIKMFSSFNSGGSYETMGYGYGPGIGENYDRLIMIISRASGAPVVAGAIKYAAELVKGKVFDVAKSEFDAAKKAGLKDILAEIEAANKPSGLAVEEVTAPPKEVVTAAVSGIEIMDLDDAVKVVWKEKIYAESGMGCTGPVLLTSEANHAKALEILVKAGYAQQQ